MNSLLIQSVPLLFEFGYVSVISNDYARFWVFLNNVTVTSFYIYTHKKFLERGAKETWIKIT
jgi:hypothetical protein